MKILHIALESPYNDGWAYQENLLPKYQVKAGHEVTILITNLENSADGAVVSEGPTDYYREDGQHIIRLEYVRFHPKKIADVYRYYKIYPIIKSIHPDFIMLHNLNNISATQILKYLKKDNPDCTVIADSHLDYNNASGFLRKRLITTVYRKTVIMMNRRMQKVYKKVYGVTPLRSEFCRDVYKIDEKKLDVLPAGADDEKINFDNITAIRAELRKNCGFGDDDFVIVTGGKIDRDKNIHLLMKAVKETDNERIKLVVFGKPNDEMAEEINALAEDEKICYVGWIDTETTYNYFLASDLAVFPGTHSVLWEQACACGIPCVFKDWYGMHHIDVGGNCMFLKEDSIDAIKTVITEIAENARKYGEMKKSAEKGIEAFSYSKIAEKAIG